MRRQSADENEFILTLITNERRWIAAGERAGVERIGVDIERLGKADRQSGLADARINKHRLEDLALVSSIARRAKVFARLNPLHAETKKEVDCALDYGAEIVMLPAFESPEELGAFVDIVAGRAEIVPLLETARAAERIGDIVRLEGFEEVMIGLNDLHLQYRLSCPMEVATTAAFERLAAAIADAELRFGFGGVARPETTGLPVPPDLVLARYAQVNARSAWIARSFFRDGLTPDAFASGIDAIRARLKYWFAQPPEMLAKAKREYEAAVATIAARRGAAS